MLTDKELPVSCSHVTDYFFFFNSTVTVHIKPTAPHHTTVLTASVKKKIQLPVLSRTLFQLDYRKTWPKMEPWPKVAVLPFIIYRRLGNHQFIFDFIRNRRAWTFNKDTGIRKKSSYKFVNSLTVLYHRTVFNSLKWLKQWRRNAEQSWKERETLHLVGVDVSREISKKIRRNLNGIWKKTEERWDKKLKKRWEELEENLRKFWEKYYGHLTTIREIHRKIERKKEKMYIKKLNVAFNFILTPCYCLMFRIASTD